ncbi:MAG TPA: hypothetical protein VFJ82_13580 [Longimicrobium sp.]|nr:hypothetical protein [Longimicrobium sp.]
MRLDLNNLAVETFSTSPASDTAITYDTGPGGPDSLCYICYNTGNFVPSCNTYQCQPQPIDPETHFYPCTNQLTCVGCA